MFFLKRRQDTRTLWLIKDDPTNKWWCRCPQGIVDAPHHDRNTYPTGGTGWLFTCIRCDKAFMFARAVRIRRTLEDIARQKTPRVMQVYEMETQSAREVVLLATPGDWLELARPIAEKLVEGQRYAFFDGRVFPAVPGKIKFQGLWRWHDLPSLPHLMEGDGGRVLSDPDYWLAERAEA